MKVLLFFILIPFLSIGQVSIDLGARKEIARFSAAEALQYFSPSFSNRYLNDSYVIKVNIEKKGWIFSTEFSSLNKSLKISESGGFTDTDYIYGGGPPGGSNLTVKTKDVSWNYNSNLKLNYIGLRLGLDRSFLDGRFNILIGASANCDFLINSMEDLDYLKTSIETTSNWNGINTTTSYSDTPNNGEAIYAVNSAYLNFGLNSALRYNFVRCYVVIFLNHTLTWYQRYTSSNDYFPEYDEMTFLNTRYNFEYGVRLGYRLNSKNTNE